MNPALRQLAVALIAVASFFEAAVSHHHAPASSGVPRVAVEAHERDGCGRSSRDEAHLHSAEHRSAEVCPLASLVSGVVHRPERTLAGPAPSLVRPALESPATPKGVESAAASPRGPPLRLAT